jgi:hypothetical protein
MHRIGTQWSSEPNSVSRAHWSEQGSLPSSVPNVLIVSVLPEVYAHVPVTAIWLRISVICSSFCVWICAIQRRVLHDAGWDNLPKISRPPPLFKFIIPTKHTPTS